MSRLTVQVGGIASPAGISDPATIVLEDGRIDSIAAGHDRPAHGPLFDARGEIAGPGLIDVHTHGAGGAQAIDGAADIDTMSRFYAAHGVTGFLASVGGTAASIERGLSGVRQTLEGGRGLHEAGSPAGARCLGAHLEGPFIDPSQPGAFRPDTIVAPDVALLEHMIGIAGGSLRLITLAPEQPGAAELIRTARTSGVVCAAGHSSASAAAMEEAIEHGVSHVTHLFNAMPGFHHRSPGLVGVALSDPRLTVEVIADGVHLDPRTVRLIARAKP
ncbi:MAG: amidohydrolase family protein, partial [Chloroflexi bacterium]|nr:amidohydrolase family protein [Chloroflexota bacterium]